MPDWLQLLIVYIVVTACAIYSAVTLLPRTIWIGLASRLSGWLGLPGLVHLPLAPLRAALSRYASQGDATSVCGGCGKCAAQPTAVSPSAEIGHSGTVHQVHWRTHRPR